MASQQPSAESGVDIPDATLFGRSALMQRVRTRLDQVAKTTVPLLIVGESGTGKEVIAHYVHSRSPRYSGPFVRINCPGIPGALLESELFGYEKGAFTGAAVSKIGLVEFACGGTLFLDSITELEFSLQAKFLQFLQDAQFTRIGGQENLHADVRIVCASSRPLEPEVQSGRFREDLFHRINVVTIDLPRLRERRLDIPHMIDFFLSKFSKEFGRKPPPMHASTGKLLAANDWPGNIRQLENIIKQYVIFGSEEMILASVSGIAVLGINPPPGSPQRISLKQVTRQATRELERKVILETLTACQWNRKRTAETLHISYRALLYKMKQSGLPTKKLNHSYA